MRILLEASEQQAIHYNIASQTKTLWLSKHCHTGMIIIQRLYNSSMRFAYFMHQGNREKQRGGGTEVLGKQTND